MIRRVKNEDNDTSRRAFLRIDRKLQDFVQKNTEHGLIINSEEDGIPQGAMLPRTTDGNEMDVTALRPTDRLKSTKPTSPEEVNNDDTYMLLHQGKMCQFWNMAFKEHVMCHSSCKGDLTLNDSKCKKWGLGWVLAVKCNQCSFKSASMKVYVEAPSHTGGRRSATVNLGMQVGLSKQGISNHGMREILAAANIIPPSTSSMQKAANKTCKLIKQTNEENMDDIRQELKMMNRLIGNAPDHPLPAEADATYNNRISSGVGKTPYQAGTQATLIVAENLTPSKKIIATQTYSKLCSCARADIDAPHNEDCTANLHMDASIANEGDYLTEAIESINESGLQIGELTIDGDSSSRAAASAIEQPGAASVKPQYCVRHLTRTMQRHIRNIKFSPSMFSGQRKSDKDRAHVRFSFDICHRVQAEFNAACSEYGPCLPQLEAKLADISDAIVDCYRGSCARCSEHSYVCSEDKPFFRNYIDVNPRHYNQREFIKPNADDIKKLRQAIAIRLGPAAIKKTATNTTQNKCEASNRGIKKAVPPSLTFKTNYAGRVHSAVHSINNNPGKSTAALCRAVGAPISDDSAVSQALKGIDKQSEYHRQRKKSSAYKESRRRRRQHLYREYATRRNEEGYHKDGSLQDVLPPLYIDRTPPLLARSFIWMTTVIPQIGSP